MLRTIITLLLVTNVMCQFDGEFWWLNSKLAKLTNEEPSKPVFEDLGEFENDETDKIVFRDDSSEINNDDKNETIINTNSKASIAFQDKSQIVWPNEDSAKIIEDLRSHQKPKYNQLPENKGNDFRSTEDVLEFVFPDSEKIWKNKQTNKVILFSNQNQNISNDKVVNATTTEVTAASSLEVDSESICTLLKKVECNRRQGVVYTHMKKGRSKKSSDSRLLCCILPLHSDKVTNIKFPDFPYRFERSKRSIRDETMSPALKQRHALMQRKLIFEIQKVKPTAQKKNNHKIATPDPDYDDPYLNIKSSYLKGYGSGTEYEYKDDYVDDYVVELPKPGLTGLYSDHYNQNKPVTWAQRPMKSFYGVDEEEDTVEEDDDEEFGGGYVDPRRVTSEPPRRRRPLALSEDSRPDSTRNIITVQSDPDFHVMEGFKLLNLVLNHSDIYTDHVRKPEKFKTTNTFKQNFESDYDFYDPEFQVFKNCGSYVSDPLEDSESGKQAGKAESGSHPWLALAVLTKRSQTILCYAAIVHPRAAVTAADCVNKKSPGDITLIAGIWDLGEDRHHQQQRMASVHIHAQYSPGSLAHDVAILYWNRPLRLGPTVQPACLSDPHVGDDCMFVGWGGYDQAIKHRPRWQRSAILTPRGCEDRLSSNDARLPSDAFCASVSSKGTVTGVGGPLICNIGQRHAAVGVAVWRDNAVVLLPIHDWTRQAIETLDID